MLTQLALGLALVLPLYARKKKKTVNCCWGESSSTERSKPDNIALLENGFNAEQELCIGVTTARAEAKTHKLKSAWDGCYQ